ncbi:MerR family transcriptional regulator [Terribacillus saccharophilus]|uniref:MerR family transcriptional regulator n=1 Tax=Terribacillus saccharophilus TaxID=361277 RepID=UPI0039826ED9
MQYLTSGELAGLLDITKYTLRHYEDQQLIQPAFIDENGYHMYGEAEVYTMAHILLLKEIGFSLKDIRASMNSEADYTKSLTSVLLKVESEIKRLSTLKGKMQAMIELQQAETSKLSKEIRDDRYFTFLPESLLDETYNLNLKMLAKDKNDSMKVLDELAYAIPDSGQNIRAMCKSDSSEADYIMPGGMYYQKKVVIEQEDELYQEIEDFYEDLAQEDAAYDGDLLIREEVYLSVFQTKSMVYCLEVKAK